MGIPCARQLNGQHAGRRSRACPRSTSGEFPPKPKIDHTIILDEKHEIGYTVRNLRLEFGPESKGTMRIRVVIPDGSGPFPALISSDLLGWAPSLIRRGYISAGYAGNDAMDDADALVHLYPEYDLALLPRRAWATSLVVDYSTL